MVVEQQLTTLIGQNAAQNMRKRGFAAAALAGDRHKFACVKGQIQTIQTNDHRLRAGVVLVKIFQGQ